MVGRGTSTARVDGPCPCATVPDAGHRRRRRRDLHRSGALERDADRWPSSSSLGAPRPRRRHPDRATRDHRPGGRAAPSADFVAHGTTVATNALLEHKGARTALSRPAAFAICWRSRARNVRTSTTFRPTSRRRWSPALAAGGRASASWPTEPWREAPRRTRCRLAVEALASRRRRAVEALAVCFLYSFLDPTHERQVAAQIRERFRDRYVALSSEVSPQFREFERLSTTVSTPTSAR